MEVWKWIIIFTVGFTVFILVLSILVNRVVYWYAKRYSEKIVNKNITDLEKLLPGKNCGSCGCATCAEYAMAVFTLEKDTDCCIVGDSGLSRRLDQCMEKFQEVIDRE